MSDHSIIDDLFPEIWLVTAKNRAPFGDAWIGPEKFVYGTHFLVARYSKSIGGDGQSVEVYENRLPARFWKIVVAEGFNSIGELQPAWTLATDLAETRTQSLSRTSQRE